MDLYLEGSYCLKFGGLIFRGYYIRGLRYFPDRCNTFPSGPYIYDVPIRDEERGVGELRLF